MSLARPNGEAFPVDERPKVITARRGTLRRTYDLAIYVARQSGVPVNELARQYKVSRKTIWLRCQRAAQAMRRGGLSNAA